MYIYIYLYIYILPHTGPTTSTSIWLGQFQELLVSPYRHVNMDTTGAPNSPAERRTNQVPYSTSHQTSHQHLYKVSQFKGDKFPLARAPSYQCNNVKPLNCKYICSPLLHTYGVSETDAYPEIAFLVEKLMIGSALSEVLCVQTNTNVCIYIYITCINTYILYMIFIYHIYIYIYLIICILTDFPLVPGCLMLI